LVEVVGVGALNWDRLFLVDRFASPGEEIVIQESKEEAGGSAANTIAGLGRLGVECGFIGKLGSDKEGDKILSAFKRDRVDLKGIKRVDGVSGSVFAFVDDEGERTMYVNPGVNDTLGIPDLDEKYLGRARFIHVSSLAGEPATGAILNIPKFIGDAKLSFSPGFLCAKGVDYLMPILTHCEILFLNSVEATALAGSDTDQREHILTQLGVKTVVVTQGSRGCLVLDELATHRVPGIKAKAVDTTGAGDAFSAGFLYGNLRGYGNLDCARIGNFTASLCVGSIGARSGLPDQDSLKSFLINL
jgi:ribokinase